MKFSKQKTFNNKLHVCYLNVVQCKCIHLLGSSNYVPIAKNSKLIYAHRSAPCVYVCVCTCMLATEKNRWINVIPSFLNILGRKNNPPTGTKAVPSAILLKAQIVSWKDDLWDSQAYLSLKKILLWRLPMKSLVRSLVKLQNV